MWCSARSRPVARSRGRPPGELSLYAWLIAITHREAATAARAAREQADTTTWPEPLPLEGHGAVRVSLDRLPGRDREVIDRCYYDGFSGLELAWRLDLPRTTIQTRARAALAALESGLDPARAIAARALDGAGSYDARVDARVSQISIAPVKGLALQRVAAVEVGLNGVEENRRLHLVDLDGRLVNGKRSMPLSLVACRLDLTAMTLALDFPGGREVAGRSPSASRSRRSSTDAPRPGASSSGRGARRSRRSRASSCGSSCPTRSAPRATAASRGRQHHLGGLRLRSRPQGGADALDSRRFRMLFEVEGVAPYAEDGWIGRPVQIGGAVVQPAGNVGRCVVTTWNPDTAERDFDTLGVLAGYRREIETTEPLPLGVAGDVVSAGRVRVGDPGTPPRSFDLGGRCRAARRGSAGPVGRGRPGLYGFSLGRSGSRAGSRSGRPARPRCCCSAAARSSRWSACSAGAAAPAGDHDLVAARHPQRAVRPADGPRSCARAAAPLVAAQLTIDESTAVAIAQEDPAPQRLGFWITGVTIFFGWNVTTLVGALAGNALGDPKTLRARRRGLGAFLALLWPRLSAREPIASPSPPRS